MSKSAEQFSPFRQLPQKSLRKGHDDVVRSGLAKTKSNLGLTKRELECLYGCGQGKTNAQIGKSLSLSARTVEHYLASAVRKLGARNRTQAVYRATRAGLLEPYAKET